MDVPRPLQLAFLGSGAFGLPTLKALVQHHQLRLIVSQPDRPAGRGKKLTPTPIAEYAAKALPGIPLYKPEDINAPDSCAHVRALAGPGKVDAWVIIAFGQKLSVPLLDGVFACNLHGSRLPRWRGAAPIHWAILSGDAITGNSVITIADRMDAGLVLGESERTITPELTTGELHDLLSVDGPALVLDVLARHAAGTLKPITQDEALVTKAKKLHRADAIVNWSQPADRCRCRINGLSPWPGVTALLQPAEGVAPITLKLLQAAPAPSNPAGGSPEGGILDPHSGLVRCGDSTALQLLRVQPAGGSAMSWSQFASGRRIAPGARLLAPSPADVPHSEAGGPR